MDLTLLGLAFFCELEVTASQTTTNEEDST